MSNAVNKNGKYTHLTVEDIDDAEEIKNAMKELDPIAQKMLLERVRGMRDMQEIMNMKTA